MKTVGFWLFSNVHNKPETASSRIRGKWLIKYWPEAEEFHYGHKYEAIIYQKVYETEHAKVYDGVKILDICDPDFLDPKIPFMEMAELCDVITTSTDALRDVVQKWTTKPVVTINDRHDLEYFREHKIHRLKAKEVSWFGYSHNSKALKTVIPHLVSRNLGLSVISDKAIELDAEERLLTNRFTEWTLETVNKEIIKSDFVIMPGSRDPNSRFKSNNKTINAYLLGMPVAVCVEELDRYLDPKNRQEDADKNYDMAVKEYDVKVSVQEMKDLIEKIKKEKGKNVLA